MTTFIVAREYNRHGDCDYLHAFDHKWVASFTAKCRAMQFDTPECAQATADWLSTMLPHIMVNTIVRAQARYKVVRL